MNRFRWATAAAVLGLLAASAVPAARAADELFFPSLVYRSGAYAPNGIPWANGVADYVAGVRSGRASLRASVSTRSLLAPVMPATMRPA